jgi:hypothetical protein
MDRRNNTTPAGEMQAQPGFEGCPDIPITSVRKLSRQLKLASFCAKSQGMNESSGQHMGKTEVRNGCLDKKKSGLENA